jgi:thioredoxin-related protein
MGKFYQRIELAANILIIVTAALIVGVLAQRYFSPAPRDTLLAGAPSVGDKLQLADFDWSKSDKNVLLVLQQGCHFCSESADFYRNLIQQTAGKNVKVVAVLPQSAKEAEKYLNGLSLTGIEVRQAELNSLSVRGTPTLIVADATGKVINVWMGKLPPEKENEVLAALKG